MMRKLRSAGCALRAMILSTSSREGSPDELVISLLGYLESPESQPGLMRGAVKIASPEKSYFSNSRSGQPGSHFSRVKTICQKCGEHYRPRCDFVFIGQPLLLQPG
ncbi:MAG: hypothetical protein ACREP3_07450 [Candidatus Binatia bacterium]